MIDADFMAMALALGRRGLGETWPNPSVGCVITKDNRIVGRGFTSPGGRPHAEANALEQAGKAAEGATIYVTLEPCAHHGRDESCSDKLLRARPARVVIALQDPDPRTNGQGVARLRAAGITVETGLMEREAALDLRGFLLRHSANRPMITLKLALSLDGRIATESGESRWITGELARKRVHLLRASHDAVMIGGGTARADDPELTIRGLGMPRPRVRIVVSARGDLPLGSKLAQTAREVPVWLCHGAEADTNHLTSLANLGVKVIACASRAGKVDLTDMAARLAQQGLTRIFCEGGGELASSLLEQDLVDELIIFRAGLALGAGGRAGLGRFSAQGLADMPRLDLISHQKIGEDLCSLWRRKPA